MAASAGHLEDDAHFWGDLCRDRVSYVRNFVFEEVNTLAACPEMPYFDPAKPFVNAWFASSDGGSLNRFLRTYSYENIERLVSEGGLSIACVHFGSNFVREGKVHREFRHRLEFLARHDGWFAPASTILDFLRRRPATRGTRHFRPTPGAHGSPLAGRQNSPAPPPSLMTPPVSVLLTVPHLNRTSSPYRETMAMASRLPACGFRLTICALREIGFQETAPLLKDLGIHAFVAPFRPTGRSLRHFLESRAAQSAIARSGPFAIQHSLDFTSSPYEALAAARHSRIFIYSQRNLNEDGHELALHVKARVAQPRRLHLPRHRRSPRCASTCPPPNCGACRSAWNCRRRRQPPRRATAGRFLFVGQIQRRKRHDDAIRALALVARDYPHARLAIAGNVFDPVYFEELKRLAAELDVASRVEFLGTRTDVPDLMRRAEAVVLCSESEAFGWVILEAMAHGRAGHRFERRRAQGDHRARTHGPPRSLPRRRRLRRRHA